MFNLIARRALLALPIVWGVSFVTFMLIHLLPGDPVLVMLSASNPTPRQIAEVRQQLHLDEPLPQQYIGYVARVLRGDLGESVFDQRPVLDEILEVLPSTIELAVAAVAIGAFLGLVLGTLGALSEGRWLGSLIGTLSLVGVSMPSFWLGFLLIFAFALRLGWLPATGQGGLARLILPAATLGLGFAAITTRLVRQSMVEILRTGYIRTAWAKGLTQRVVIVRHALTNALIPVITVVGVQLGNLLAGTIIVETVFSRQGIGRLAVIAILDRDFPLVQGVVLVSALGYVLVNLVVDLAYLVVDPRTRVA